MLSFALYLIGSIVCIAGLACIATLLGAAPTYVTISAVVFLAMAVVVGAIGHIRVTRQSAS
jgi:hypothetical protein